MKHTLFLKWALFSAVVATLSVVGVKLGAVAWIQGSDRTGIAFLICVVGYLTTGFLGVQAWRTDLLRGDIDSSRYERLLAEASRGLRWGRRWSGVCRDLGLLGTIIGFVLILASFATFDASQAEQINALIKSIGSNLGTAFVTTLGGLVASILVDLQCNMLEEALRGVSDDE